ncbi:DNA ligase D [Legionella maioricensis]|uniref:DNA ligase (ATP) n=1 Tax=Legionella maioricensis TaxID=2896528 RepID=A0A9X2CZF4_9GAMM|nr:DNA ligase D [Legionella maioricensis]MCL9683638.1 DNA ligase D [Legionella maioricensis]MCL9687660.1 DNA ligase D [Legionella maioricensis]
MTLKKYHQKRDFKKTSEPKGKISHQYHHLFIIQKHAARHLHYDFRIELDGVLKSWAIPKGPCLDPSVKRLAMHVEDHPVEYGFFEGIIPKGEYGGGTVMLWDKGVWKPLDDHPLEAYQKGHLRFELDAEKLKGRWDLIRFKDEQHWFLIKHQDEQCQPLSDYDITEEQPNSVLTNQSIDEISEHYNKVWMKQGSKKITSSDSPPQFKTPKLKGMEHLKTSPFPEFISPQLATLASKAPTGDDWLHEVKFDGYRILAFIDGDRIILKSRNNKEWTHYFPGVVEDIKALKLKKAVFDGEIVLLNKEGKSDFQLLQNSIKEDREAPYIYYIFDLLYYDQYDLMPLPLIKRKEWLHTLLKKQSSSLHYSDYIQAQGPRVFKQACHMSLEGIISKEANAPYITKRSKGWLKIKCIERQEFVIGGYTPPKGGRHYFGSLFLGFYNNKGELVYSGKVGTGFSDSSLQEVGTLLQKYVQPDNPFNTLPPESRGATWVKPTLVAEVEFTEWTAEGYLRHPSFQGLRLDKKAKSVKKELAQSLEKPEKLLKSQSKPEIKKKSSSFKISHPDKIIYPEDHIAKEDLLHYYEFVSHLMLPYLKNRPLTLLRCPEDYQHCFYQRHYNEGTPAELKAITIESKKKREKYIYLDDKKGLLSLVQMGVLEIHPWGSQIKTLEYPDWITIDLDPAPDVEWKKVVAAAFDVKRNLEQYKLTSFVKTTGGKGLHVVIPIKPKYDWDAIKNFTHVFVRFMEQLKPKEYIGKMSKSKRTGKIFIDYLRNQRSATAIAVYSTRARPHAPLSIPIEWDELSHDKSDTDFFLKNIFARLDTQKIDPWQNFLKMKQSLPLDDLE